MFYFFLGGWVVMYINLSGKNFMMVWYNRFIFFLYVDVFFFDEEDSSNFILLENKYKCVKFNLNG